MINKRIRLTENDLHKIVKESVNRVLNEISMDTLYSAARSADDKMRRTPQYSNPKQYSNKQRQRKLFGSEYSKRMREREDNPAFMARTEKNANDIEFGRRKYVSGKGWRTRDSWEDDIKKPVEEPKTEIPKKKGFWSRFRKN